MFQFISKSIVLRFNFIILPIITICFAFYGGFLGYYNYTHSNEELLIKADNVSAILEKVLVTPIWNVQISEISETLLAVMQDNDIVLISVEDETGEILAQEVNPNSNIDSIENLNKKLYLLKRVSIQRNDLIIGKAQIIISKEKIKSFIETSSYFLVLFTLLITLFLGGSIWMTTDKTIRNPIYKLKKSADLLSKGTLDIDINTNRSDEIGSLASSFSDMRNSIKERILDLRELNKTSEEMAGSSDEKEVLLSALKVMKSHYDISKGIIFLQSKTSDVLEIASYFSDDKTVFDKSYSSLKQINQKILEEKKILYFSDLFTNELFDNSSDNAGEFKDLEAIFIPMLEHQTSLGIIAIFKEKGSSFLENIDQEFSLTLARMAVVNYKNLHMLQIIEDYSKTLEQKVIDRTQKLKAAQKKLISLEKQTLEKQMAGGFAHEIKNALAGARLILSKVYDIKENNQINLCEENSTFLKKILLFIKENTQSKKMAEVIPEFQEINSNQKELSEALSRIFSRLNKAIIITDEIVNYSKLTELTPGVESILILPLINRVVNSFQDDFQDHNIHFKIKVDDLSFLKGSESHYFSIIFSIVKNAFEAIVEKSTLETTYVSISLINSTEHKTLIVEDEGIGMNSDVQKKMFDPFYSTKPQTGIGLELGAVQKLVELYNGKIDVQSEENIGTKFQISFPS